MTTARTLRLPATMLLSIAAAAVLVPMPLPGQAAERVQQVEIVARRMSVGEQRAYDAGVIDGRRSVLQARAESADRRVEAAGQRPRSERVAVDERGAARGQRL